MTPALLCEAATALWGPRWRRELARASKRHRNSIARWERGLDPIPEDVREALYRVAVARGVEIEKLTQALAG